MYLKNGTVLNNRYRIDGIISKDTNFSVVYKAMDLLFNYKVAVKEFFSEKIMYRDKDCKSINLKDAKYRKYLEEGKENFNNEGKIIKKLFHKNIIYYHDSFKENNTIYLVSKYYDGVTLKQYLENNDMEDKEFLEKIYIPILETVDYIHKEGYIHRDIKPNNIMINEKREIILIDFGSAIKKDKIGKKSVFMTPGFSPIELYSGESSQKEYSDIYSLSALLYYYYSGIVPKDARERLIEDNLVKLGEYGIKINLEIENQILKNMEMNYKKRDQNLEKYKEFFQKYLEKKLSISYNERNQSRKNSFKNFKYGILNSLLF